MPSRSRKLLLTSLVLGSTAAVAGVGVFAAFTAVTSNTGNSIASGTVAITNNGSSALYVVTNGAPGAATVSCIHVQYTGSLPSTVHLYRTGTVNNGTLYNLKIERGSGVTGGYPSCTGFTSAATIYTGTLGAFPTTYATGPDGKGSAWAQNDAVDYRFTASVVDDPTPNAHSAATASGSHNFVWEADSN